MTLRRLSWSTLSLAFRPGRLGWGLGGLLVGMVAVGAWTQDELQVMWTLRESAITAQQEPATAVTQAGLAMASVPMPAGPVAEAMPQVWPWLQARLQDHGLQVSSLQPQMAFAAGRPTSETGVQLQLQGRWSDWQAFVQQMNAQVPWWQLVSWHVVPINDGSARVRMQMQWRLGWRTPRAHEPDETVLPDWQPAAASPSAVALFGPPDAAAVQAAVPTADALAPGGERTELTKVQFLGVWQQSGQGHAVFVQAGKPEILLPGQRLGSYRLRRVHSDGVELQDAQGKTFALTIGRPGR